MSESSLRRGPSRKSKELPKAVQAEEAEEESIKKTTSLKRTSSKQTTLKVIVKKKSVEKDDESETSVEKTEEITETKTKGRKRKAPSVSDSETKKIKTDLKDLELPPLTKDDSQYFKIVAWNVNGLNAITSKGYLQQYVEKEQPDVLFLQETKVNVPIDWLPNYYPFWNFCKTKKGYSGTAFFLKKKPIAVTNDIGMAEHDQEGRAITVEFEKFYLVGTYVPNAGQKLDRLGYKQKWDEDFLGYLKKLEKTKPVVWCGDLNVCHKEIDIANPKSNAKSAGFTKEERADFDKVLGSGFVDVWRARNPGKVQYTYWSYKSTARANNVGWRLDYFVASDGFAPQIADCFVRDGVLGSDHCPIGILIPKDAAATE